MKLIRQSIGYLPSALNWGVLVLTLAVTLGSSEVTSAATLRTINLNTGYDQWAASPALIPVGGVDNEWRVVVDPTSLPPEPSGNGVSTGRPADVVIDVLWTMHPSGGPAPYQNSRWISINHFRIPSSTVPSVYQYAYYFTLPPGSISPQLTMDLNADNQITNVTLNPNTTNCVLFNGSGGEFDLPPTLHIPPFSQQNCFTSGSTVNVLVVTVKDTSDVFTGLIVAGTVTYEDCDRPAVRQIPGLQFITFFESTFATPTSPTFAISVPAQLAQLTTQIGALGLAPNNDFEGAPGEFYDVFFSNWDGTVNPNGEFVTIEAVLPVGAPFGGGLNIAAVQLNFATGPPQLANFVSSFVVLGDNAIPADVGRAVDPSTVTDTTMGNTGVSTTQRLRVTVGFPCCVPPPSGMVAWWPFDEGAGATSFQDLIGGNNATPFASPVGGAQAPQPVSGTVNGAIHFPKFGNGLSGAQVSPQGALVTVGAADFTIDAWVEFQSAPANRLHYIVNRFDTVQNMGYALYVISPGIAGNERLEFKWGDGTNVSTVQTSPPITPGQFHHVAVTFARNVSGNALDIRLYVDGAQQGQQTGNPPGLGSLANFLFLEIGQQPGTIDEPITIDELEIFNVALSLSDIQSIYNAGSAGKCKPCVQPPSGMVAWWPLDEQAGANVVYDILGFDNNGTPQPGTVGGGGPIPVAGHVGGALYFYGGPYIEVPPATNVDLANSDLTIDGWFASFLPGSPSFGGIPNWSPGQTIYDAIVDKLDPSTTPNSGYAFFVRTQATPLPFPPPTGYPVTITVDLVFALGGNIYTAQIYSGITTFPPPSGQYPPPTPPWPYGGQWLHVAVTVDRITSIGTFYLNGNPVGTFAPAAGVNNTAPLWIGQSRLPVSGFEFGLDEIEIFNRALDQSDIQSIYSAGPAGKCRTTDTTPDPFTFTDLTGVPRNTVQTSNVITVSGITAPAVIAVVGGEYELNSSGTWTSGDGTVADGDTVRVRHTSAATVSTAVHTTLTIGGVSDTFTSTTRGPDLTGVWNPVSQSCLQNKCKLKGSVRVVNQGTATAGASRLRVLLSDDAVPDPSDAVLKESKIKKLKSGHGKTSKVKVTLPLGITASGKYLFAVIDTLNLVVETDETNNTPMTGPIP